MRKSDMEEMISVPKWVLESIKDTLRIQYDIYERKTDTCQKRNVKEALILSHKLLKGDKITGMERTEKL